MKEEKKCNGTHCRCMNIGGTCPNMHYAECTEHNPALASKPTPHTDQFEEIKQEFVEAFRQPDGPDWSYLPNDQIANWWLSKLSHIRRETEKGMMEKVRKEWNRINRLDHYDKGNDSYWENEYGNCHAISMHISEHDKFCDFLYHLEGNSVSKTAESDTQNN